VGEGLADQGRAFDDRGRENLVAGGNEVNLVCRFISSKLR
jgi:hypothetical protein